MARVAFEALEDKKGEDTCVIDISHISVLADYFVISNGNSDSQVRALVDNVGGKDAFRTLPLAERAPVCRLADR